MIENELLERENAVTFLENMDTEQLTRYIGERLKGKTIMPPLSTRSDEYPEYFLEKVYERSQNNEFKARFRGAIAKLLANEQLEISDPDYLASLLIFCEQFIISEAVGPVAGMALSSKLKGISSIQGDLHLRAMMALARLPQGLNMTDIWKNALDDYRYTSAAFAALRAQGLKVITQYLPRFTQSYLDNPGSIDLEVAVLTLFEEFQKDYSETEIIEFVWQSVENESREIVDTVNNILESIGKKPPPTIERSSDATEHRGQYFSLKSYLCFFLTQKEDKMKEITPAVRAWKEIARMEKNFTREAKWADFESKLSAQEALRT